MTPQATRILTECDTMLADITRRYHIARRRLTEVEPGYPAHTPGAGEPGRAKGYVAGSITERLATQHHPELDTAQRLDHGPTEIAKSIIPFADALNLPMHGGWIATRQHVQRLTWCRWIIRQIINHPDYDPPTKPLTATHRTIADLHRIVITWGTKPTTPTHPAADPTMLPEDFTGDLCRSCLRVGSRSVRYRGELCRWCYDFAGSEGFIPPPQIIEARASGKPITEPMVAPHRKAYRDKQKKQRKA
jgi:hypothetical protein